ncbi:hypothetical protein [Pseudonocardia spinosispora]|uniref:hypothetical protein n=1 Tax=Pseudonocardia spinosispora TaxID=103441 RepID=UPI0012EC0E33|nr:hypothetical protein [Pseudonocardia spinosispora]
MLGPAVLAVVASVWLLLVPVTVVYVTGKDHPAPYDIATRYSWWTTEQNFVYSDTGTGQVAHLVNGVRLDCSNIVGTSDHELAAPSGPAACASVESPRFIWSLVLFGLGLTGLLLVAKVPARPRNYQDRYRMPRAQRRALKRGRYMRILLVIALLAGLAGCAEDPGPPSADKVKATLERLGANPDTLYLEQFVATSPVTGQMSRQVLTLVPAKDAASYQIVDSQGEVFDDYNDFLRNNNLPDIPGPDQPGRG